MTPLEKQQAFHKELKALLLKYKAQITLEDIGRDYFIKNQIVVEFDFDESLFQENNTGIVPELVLGAFEDGT